MNDEDRSFFLNTLKSTKDRFNWILHAYCLMDNHYHLLVETPDANLSKGMRQINGVYTLWFNRIHNRSGPMFQGRFRSVPVQKGRYLLEVARYIVLNPIRTRTVATPEQYPWTSYNGAAGLRRHHPCLDPGWILSQFGYR